VRRLLAPEGTEAAGGTGRETNEGTEDTEGINRRRGDRRRQRRAIVQPVVTASPVLLLPARLRDLRVAAVITSEPSVPSAASNYQILIHFSGTRYMRSPGLTLNAS
jgi:hypothetical protein